MARGYPDFEGDKSKVYLTPEWAAKEGTDKTFQTGATNKATLEYATAAYAVPAGKTLYITQAQCSSYGTLAADRDNNQICYLGILINSVLRAAVGGNGGASLLFPKPLVVEGGVGLDYYVYNLANHNCDISICLQGYEV